MDSTLLAGEYFTLRPIASNDVATLKEGALVMHAFPPDPSKQFMKRIVGVPGDTLQMEKGVLHRNSRTVSEPYAWHVDPAADPTFDDFDWQREYLATSAAPSSYRPSRDNWGPLLVPRNAYFVLGDNRDNSLDSRYWGFVPFDAVIGTPRRIYWSQDPATHAVRWKRIGHRLE
jgi:signal peptidase I